jgi:hypothetical protein
MNSAAPVLPAPLDVFRTLEVDTPVRVVTHREVITDHFRALDETGRAQRVKFGSSEWLVSAIRAVAVLEQSLEKPTRSARPSLGCAGRIARLDDTWDTRLAAPEADLAIVGTLKWLREDLEAYLTREGDPVGSDLLVDAPRSVNPTGHTSKQYGIGGALADLLLPKGKDCATWFTRLYPSARFAEHLPLPGDIRAAILDGTGAIMSLTQVEAPVVICILDRSVADETAAEMVIQLRNSRGEPLSLNEDLAWRPPAGVEALAFTVAL